MDHSDFILQINTKSEWGSDSEDFRRRIRNDIFAQFKSDDLLDLSTFPKIKDPFVSISHTTGLGGWVAATTPVGFDIESTDRQLSPAALKRLASPKEQTIAPSSIALWVAKEASFKSLWTTNSVRTISQIEVHSWQPIRDGGYSYLFNHFSGLGHGGEGRLFASGRFTLGISKVTP